MKRNDELVFDIGMHKGEDTAYYLRKGFKVVAFEANPELIEHCKARFSKDLTAGQLCIVEGAIASPSAGSHVTFFKNERSVWGTISADWSDRNMDLGAVSAQLTVSRVDIKDAIATHGMPHFIKIDIEGADNLVLEALNDFSDRPKYISIETDKESFASAKTQIEMMRQLGYSKFAIVEQSTIPNSTLRTKSLSGEDFEYTFEPHSSGAFGEDLGTTWQDADRAIKQHRWTSSLHYMLGDRAVVGQTAAFWLRRLYKVVTGRRGAVPGWQDTHAAL